MELYDVAIAEVNENLKITDLKIVYDPNPMLLQFYGGRDKCLFLQTIPQCHCHEPAYYILTLCATCAYNNPLFASDANVLR